MAPTTAPTTAIRHALSTLAAPSIIATVGVGLELAVVKFIDRRGTPEPVGTGFTPVGSIGKVVVTGVTEEGGTNGNGRADGCIGAVEGGAEGVKISFHICGSGV